MPEGALLTNTVETVLLDLADSRATGCLVVRDQEGDEAEVYLRDGQVYSVMVPGRRVMLGVRLMSSGALTPEALAEALEIQRTELQGWRLGELLVHLGYVELAVVEEFVVEHLKDALADLFGWPVAAWKFRKNKKTRQDVAPPTSVAELLDDLRDRATTWEQILAAIGGPAGVPVLDSGTPSDDVPLGPNEWALLCKVDGERSVADLAGDCGFTLFEAGQVVARLADAGLVAVPGAEPVAGSTSVEADVEPGGVEDVAVESPAAEDVAVEAADETGPELLLPLVDAAELEDLAGDEAGDEAADDEAGDEAGDDEAAEEARRAEDVRRAAEHKRLQEAEILHRELEALAQREAAAREERAEARRKAREVEAERVRNAAAYAERADAEPQAWVDHAEWLAAERAAAEAPAWSEHRERLEHERRAVEEQAWADHAGWLTEARAAAEDVAWSDHAAWLRAERAAVEGRAWAEHAQHLAAERAAAEERAWADHRLWLAEQRRAVEEQAWVEHDAWLAAQAAEAERLAHEQAERELRAEAERRTREQAEREQAEREAEARRHAAAELARFTAQEQARQAAEAQAQVAAEQEAARQATERAAADRPPRQAGPADEDVAAGAALAAHAASMLTELNRDVPAQRTAAPEVPPAPVDAPAPDTEQAAAPDEPIAPLVARDSTDTAMLLRELSSLGLGGDDERPAAPSAPAPAPRPAPHLDAKKKRKGLFGRG